MNKYDPEKVRKWANQFLREEDPFYSGNPESTKNFTPEDLSEFSDFERLISAPLPDFSEAER